MLFCPTLLAGNRANGRYLPRVCSGTCDLSSALLTSNVAIEHIRHLKSSDGVVRRDAERMKMELEMGRRNQEEIRALQTEISHMWNDIQRLDPNRAHVYGAFTSNLAHDQARATAAPPPMLPPVQHAPPPGPWGQPSAGAMQGVEYPGPTAQPYEHR